MTRRILALCWCLVLPATVPAQLVPCPGSGLTMTVSGGRLGDPFAVTTAGAPPGAPGLFGVSVTGVPTATPYGFVCLGALNNAVLTPVTYDGSGASVFSGILPPVPGVAGTDYFLQSAAFTASTILLSNGVRAQPRAPGVWLASNNNLLFIDAVTDQARLVQPLGGFSDGMAYAPGAGLVTVSHSPGVITCVDERTDAVVSTIPWAWVNGPRAYEVDAPGTGLLLFDVSLDPFTLNPLPFASLTHVALPSGVQLNATSLPAPPGLGTADVLVLPGTSIAYVRNNDKVWVVDYATGSLVGSFTIPFPQGFGYFADWCLVGPLLYVLSTQYNGSGLTVIDTTNHGVVGPPVFIPGTPGSTDLAYGPGSTTPALYIATPSGTGPPSNAFGSITEIDPTSLVVRNQRVTPLTRPVHLELSPQGSEWYLFNQALAGAAHAVMVMDVSTGTFSATLSPAIAPGFVGVASATLGRGYLLSSATTVNGLSTDPLGAATTSIALPTPLSYPVLVVGNAR